ncbi:MAG: PEP-utilizing enzyme [Gaiellales bacterium]
MADRAFTSPFDIETPAGADGWQEMYPYYYVFSDARRAFEEEKFWFFDGMHNPEPVYPFDAIMTENWAVAVNQLTTRVWLIPPSLGIDHRVVNGYLYISPNAITDPEVIAQRAEHFTRRAGHYFENWDAIYADWVRKAEDCIARLKEISFAPLPEMEDERVVTEHHGVYATYHLQRQYEALIASLFEMGSYHFEMLNLGYGAYLTFREFCQGAFPGITDRTVARMVAGIDILLFRPDDEIRKLARAAIDLGLADVVLAQEDPQGMVAAIAAAPNGDRWVEQLEAAKDPWFWYSTGAGYTHTDRAWMDDMSLPMNALRGYVQRIVDGEDIDRPLEQVLEERDRITAEYADLLADADQRTAFLNLVQLARTVYPYVENHNFYVEHWHHSIFWSKVRELGRVFVAHGFFADEEDIFFLRRTEVADALYDLSIGWATGTDPRGPTYWPEVVARRRDMYGALARWTPPPALGKPPEQITEPLTIMLWGITQEVVDEWLGGSGGGEEGVLRGVAASGGIARGRARVVTTAADLVDVEQGDILVCRITAPSWAPVFSRISAAVSDIGGIMAHTAIVSREYGLPAVVGTGFATQTISTGQYIEVNGDDGIVRLIEEGTA